jgi:hypothetical protein
LAFTHVGVINTAEAITTSHLRQPDPARPDAAPSQPTRLDQGPMTAF